MKYIKYLLIIAVLTFGTNLALAVSWTPPTATPPAGNTEMPINIGPDINNIGQNKVGTIGAYKFCLYNSVTKKFDNCLGQTGSSPTTPPTTPIAWPWTQIGSNLENSNGVTGNNGNVYIKDQTLTYDNFFTTAPQKLTVEGLIKAVGFCLGSSCVKIGTGPGEINDNDGVNNWTELINKYGGGTPTLDQVAAAGANTGKTIGVGGLNVAGYATLLNPPTAANHAVTKAYVDAQSVSPQTLQTIISRLDSIDSKLNSLLNKSCPTCPTCPTTPTTPTTAVSCQGTAGGECHYSSPYTTVNLPYRGDIAGDSTCFLRKDSNSCISSVATYNVSNVTKYVNCKW